MQKEKQPMKFRKGICEECQKPSKQLIRFKKRCLCPECLNRDIIIEPPQQYSMIDHNF